MHRRVNITLPEETLKLIDRATDKGDRSRFIDTAIRHFIRERQRGEIRRLVKEGAIRNAERDLSIVKEWFRIDDDGWRRSGK
jgi:CopG family transcriptional regulator / antitoxin EndoAI